MVKSRAAVLALSFLLLAACSSTDSAEPESTTLRSSVLAGDSTVVTVESPVATEALASDQAARSVEAYCDWADQTTEEYQAAAEVLNSESEGSLVEPAIRYMVTVEEGLAVRSPEPDVEAALRFILAQHLKLIDAAEQVDWNLSLIPPEWLEEYRAAADEFVAATTLAYSSIGGAGCDLSWEAWNPT